ncbi:GNAT family protein [Streptomyces sp. NPDC048161]|uniref:GNAT family N-acetyltransferase n=1 Tax=unclassified Streptomyces TaxID=2593676 RepID=UPI00081BBBD8|nr:MULTISPECIES: GNAT family protein [unclassified Streptomyces]MYQ87351.1 GNAT family N-acetyltransferase [Streptomyces sp. SID4936]SCE45733.1 Protein N-acetyltransferase, RimJ/RimL family [Streptomyces sp. DvalAA-43]
MTEDTAMREGIEHDAEVERELSWRAKSIGLAAVDMDDAELLHSWRSDPVTAYEIGAWPRSLTAMRERIERDSADDDRDDFLVLLPDRTPIGHTALSGQNIVNGTAQVELMLAPQHRGHGHGTDALDALVDLAFGELPMHRLTAETHTDNAPALAVLARSGFVREGTSRAACLHRGRRHDLAVFSLLRPEWETLNRPRAWDA